MPHGWAGTRERSTWDENSCSRQTSGCAGGYQPDGGEGIAPSQRSFGFSCFVNDVNLDVELHRVTHPEPYLVAAGATDEHLIPGHRSPEKPLAEPQHPHFEYSGDLSCCALEIGVGLHAACPLSLISACSARTTQPVPLPALRVRKSASTDWGTRAASGSSVVQVLPLTPWSSPMILLSSRLFSGSS